MTALELYLGRDRLKKHVCADGRNASGCTLASPMGAWILNGMGKAWTEAGMRLRAHTNLRNCTRCSELSSSRMSQNHATCASSSETPPSYSATARSSGMEISRRPQRSSCASRGLKRLKASTGTTRLRPSSSAARRARPSESRSTSTCWMKDRAISGLRCFSSSGAFGTLMATTEPSLRFVERLNASQPGSMLLSAALASAPVAAAARC
mmetsp:Transcript_37483/g.117153  ORF Transcript_37483/g.117153 Transcript_37483/m.117153 type:complete len:209 (+) Transcript_37483:421-1047(+)